jgi:hypothetical protein
MSDQLKAPRNTNTRDERDNFLLKAFASGSSDGLIEGQEAEGQTSFVNSDTLPRRTNGAPIDWSRLGIKLLGPVPDDELFQYVELPAGWAKRPTDHSMWSDLVDDKGRVRANIFYKAAFYDRGAHISLARRFSVVTDYELQRSANKAVAMVKDGDTVVFRTEPLECSKHYWNETEAAEKNARAWLAERYPDFQDPHAYWD